MMQQVSIKKYFWIALFPIVALACGAYLPFVTQTSVPTREAKENVVIVYPTQTAIAVPQIVLDEQSLLINLYASVNPAVVNITNYGTQASQLVAIGQGSGFVYDQKGHIITNAHVVIDADQLDVTFSDGTVMPADIVGKDLNSDLAVIKVKQLPNGVIPLPLGDIDHVLVGQTVIAIGNPFGLEGTLTRGIISALGRTIPALTPFSIPQAIQTDAAINPGNSGGPLLNLEGEVIGVNAQIETGGITQTNSGVGFAIPVSILKIVVPELIEKGTHQWAWLGVQGGDLNPVIAEANNLPVDRGAYIAKIISGGPSDKAGLRGTTNEKTINGRMVDVGGDVIVAINGQTIQSFDDLLIYIALEVKPGQEVTLTIYRNGKIEAVKLILEVRPEQLE